MQHNGVRRRMVGSVTCFRTDPPISSRLFNGGELTHSYSVESDGEVKKSKLELIQRIEDAGFEAVERDTMFNRVDTAYAR